jgi:hypothetical protein
MLSLIRNVVHPVCPSCNGSGGSEGYYGGDWTGCLCCNPNEDREEPVVRIWFWQVWRYRYDMWKLDRWVDRQIEADQKKWAAEEARSMSNGDRDTQ